MPLVSVIIPVYNIAPHLCQCLDSVLEQSLPDLEIICVDDGSTDECPAILARYAVQDSRMTVITQENGGPGAARNAGLERACGQYIIFLDSDDWFEPNFLERIVARAEKTGADVTICRGVEFDTCTGQERASDWMLKTAYLPNKEVFTPEEVGEHLLQFTYGWPWDKLYRTEFMRGNGLNYPLLPNSEDLVFVFLSMAVAGRISVLDQVLVHHRVNRKSSVSNSLERNPDAPAKALFMLRDGLRQRGLYKCYERSFLNWAMEFFVWQVSNMERGPVRHRYFKTLRQEWLPILNFSAHPVSYYENRVSYAKYLLAKYAPYPLFCAAVAGYKAGKNMVST